MNDENKVNRVNFTPRNRVASDSNLITRINKPNARLLKKHPTTQAKILEYKLIPVGFSKDDQVQRYRVFLKIDYELRDIINGKRLQYQKIETEIEFEISSKVDESDKNRNDAVEKGAENFSLELLDTIFETF